MTAEKWKCSWWGYLLATIAGGYLLTGYVGVFAATPPWPTTVLVTVVYTATLSCWMWVLARKPAAATATLLIAATLAGATITHWIVPFSGIPLFYAAVWLAPFRTRLWQAVTLTAAAVGGFVTVSLHVGLGPEAAFGIPSGLPWSLAFAVILQSLAKVRAGSEEVAHAKAQEAVLAERQRLAREIHDVLAHSLSAQAVHLEAARLLLERDADSARVLDRVTRAGDMARFGLVEAQRAVEALRGDQPPLTQQLEQLAGEFSAASGSPCEITLDVDPAALPPEASLAVTRTAQEALANVLKHAPGASVQLGMQRDGSWWELSVRDAGGRAGEPNGAGGGYGLIGLRERAELLGGELDAGADGAGFAVRLRVPA